MSEPKITLSYLGNGIHVEIDGYGDFAGGAPRSVPQRIAEQFAGDPDWKVAGLPPRKPAAKAPDKPAAKAPDKPALKAHDGGKK